VNAPPPEMDFRLHCYSIHYQAMIALGLAPNPMTGETEKDLGLAKRMIDTLEMLREKTEGNRTDEETKALMGWLFELRMRYVEVSKSEKPAAE